jgi:hypothetical protein
MSKNNRAGGEEREGRGWMDANSGVHTMSRPGKRGGGGGGVVHCWLMCYLPCVGNDFPSWKDTMHAGRT